MRLKKMSRNRLCLCGSQRKYKNCCGRKERNMKGQKTMPSNDFRKELEEKNVDAAELMLRDQRIMARAMEANHVQAGFRREMLEKSRIELASLSTFMQNQPYSPGLPDLLEASRMQHEACVKALDAPDVSRADLVQLAALESAIESAESFANYFIIPAVEDIKSDIEDDGLPKGDTNGPNDDIPEEEHEMVDPGSKSVKVE